MPDADANGDLKTTSPLRLSNRNPELGDDNGTQEFSGVAPNPNDAAMDQSLELTPPPLPPRPSLAESRAGSLRLSKRASRPKLQSQATTAVSRADVHTQSHLGTESIQSSPASRAASRKPSFTQLGRFVSNVNSDADDSASLKSFAPTLDAHFDGDSTLGSTGSREQSLAWRSLNSQIDVGNAVEPVLAEDDVLSVQMQTEFGDLDSLTDDGSNEDTLLESWKAKLKHFFILSASGKPVYSRHGDDQLTSHYIGVVQTLISFYQGANDPLRGFTAGETRFVILPKGPLNLVAVSRLKESDSQLRTQLEALYMQVLSTLTLPSMERMFSNRPSTDLRRALQGTDVLLDGLADEFTRGSPSTLLSALECLRLRKTDRKSIDETFLNVRSANLLYGLIVAAGRLVSVVRPKKHSLHPGDLHLIFNMLFAAGSVRAGGGENWIPLCLPGFNNTGFLYMYVSFFSTSESVSEPQAERPLSAGANDELAVVLISANKESFFELRTMRNNLVAQLEKNGCMNVIKTSIRKGRSACSEIVPASTLR